MKINLKILLITFLIVFIVLGAAGFAFSSIMMNVLTSRETTYLLSSTNDFIVTLSEIDKKNDEVFETFLENPAQFKRETGDPLNFIFELTADSIIARTGILYANQCQIPDGPFTIDLFARYNPILIIKSKRLNTGKEYLYGYVFSPDMINYVSERAKINFAFFDNGTLLSMSNETKNRQKFYQIGVLYKSFLGKNNFELAGGGESDGYILATIYRIKENTYSNKLVDVLVFSTISEAVKLKQTLQNMLVLLGISGIFLSVVLTILFTSNLREQIKKLSTITDITKTGNFKARISVLSKDELGELANSFNHMLIELDKKERLKNEYTDFITLINRNPSLIEVASAVLSNILVTGGFKRGKIFLAQGVQLNQLAQFGFLENHDHQSSLIYIKDVLKTKEDILLELPYINTDGEAVEEKVLFCPILSQQDVIGIVQLHSDVPLEKETYEYLNKIREQLAVGLMNALSLSKLEELVIELKNLNEEYQKQNEFIKSQNEKLRELHEQLTEKALELAVQKKKAEESTKLKSEFVATISHELRTPMNAILGLTELLLSEKNLTVKNRERLEVVLRSAKRLVTLIDGILDISKIESGRMDLRIESFPLSEILIELEQSVKHLAELKSLRFEINDHTSNGEKLSTDKYKLLQILVNLSSNALKFTEKGFVRISIFRKEEGRIRFEVEDSGIGIPEDQLTAIFEEFRQVDSSLTRKFSGSGLGLSISRSFAKMLRGKLTVKSRLNSGSTFILDIPNQLEEIMEGKYGYSQQVSQIGENEKHSDAEITTYQEGDSSDSAPVFDSYQGNIAGTVLIVDDDADTLFTLNELVKQSNCRTLLAKNGIECLEILEETIPDLILMDLMMPLLNGYDTVKKIRSVRKYNSIPIVAISAKVQEDNGKELLDIGFSGYISKPFDAKALSKRIRKIFNPKNEVL